MDAAPAGLRRFGVGVLAREDGPGPDSKRRDGAGWPWCGNDDSRGSGSATHNGE
jgi:hypothetical protein